MPYNDNIPQAGNKLRNSQLDLLNNFQAIGTGFALNHVALDLAAAGQHTHLTMQLQAASPATAASTQEVYNFLNTETGFNELYIKKNAADVQSGKTLLDVPFTASVLSGLVGSTFGSAGWTYLPSGLLVVWGRTATTAIPGAGNILNVPFTFGGKSFATEESFSIVVSTRRTAGNNISSSYVSSLTVANGAVDIITTGGSGSVMVTFYAIGLGA